MPLDPAVHADAFAYLTPRGWTPKSVAYVGLRWIGGDAVARLWPCTKEDGGDPAGAIVLVDPRRADYASARVFWRVEPNAPRPPKYLSPAGEGLRVLVPRGISERDLASPRLPLTVVESWFKAAVAAARGIRAVVGVNGCGGCRVPGAKLPRSPTAEQARAFLRPELHGYLIGGRRVSFLTDGDYRTNLDVRRDNLTFMDAAAVGFGCEPALVELPDGDGIDDFLAAHSVADFEKLPRRDRGSREVIALRCALFDLTEIGLADRFEALHAADCRHDPRSRVWYTFSPTGWARGDVEPRRRMEAIVTGLRGEIEVDRNTPAERYREAKRLQARRRIDDGLGLAALRPAVEVDSGWFDAEQNYFGVANGVLDLTTGRLVDAEKLRGCYVTKRAPHPWEPDAAAPRWAEYLAETTGGDRAMAAFLQEVAGAALHGRPSRQELIFVWGPTGSGKSVFIETLHELLGPDYSVATKASLLIRTRSDDPERPTPFLMSLRGKRLAHCSELPEGVVINDAFIKDLTGGDTIPGRHLHGEAEAFRNTARVLVRCNELPGVTTTNDATWERIIVIPFARAVPEGERDPDLRKRLIAAEAPGILAWAHAGLRRYARRGYRFDIPRAANEKTLEYRRASDTVGHWLDDNVAVDETDRAAREIQDHVTADYTEWCRLNGHRPLSSKNLWASIRGRLRAEPVAKIGGEKWALGFRLNRRELRRQPAFAESDGGDGKVVQLRREPKC